MTVDTYKVLARAIEDGVAYGITRLWKYHDSDTMTEAQMRENADRIVEAILNEVCEWLRFDDE